MIETALFITGIIAGAVNAVAGGGVLFVFPVMLLAGLSPLSAAMTCSFAGWPGAMMSAYGYRKDIRKVPERYYWLVFPAIGGSVIGSYALIHTSHTTFETVLPWLILLSVALFAFQPQLHRYIHRPAHMRHTSPLLLLCLFIFPVSIYAGYFGAGFGFIMLAILGFTKLKNIYQINGMKNFIASGISLSCGIIYSFSGHVAWEYVIFPLVGSLLGGYIGSKLAHRISPHATRAVVVLMGLFVVGSLFGNIF
jgi:uncharacterized membrane protein YfcA